MKTNVGHLEAAAGIASLIKVVLSMSHGVIPGHLNLRVPNPSIDWDRLPVRVTAKRTAWPLSIGRPPRAGVSAFGFSGTNAHIVVEASDIPDGSPPDSGELVSQAGRPPGSPWRVPVSQPESVAQLVTNPDPLRSREKRILPLSGKSVSAVQSHCWSVPVLD